MIQISRKISLPDNELKEEFFLSSGAGGQHVNKVATAVRLRFNPINSKALPEDLKKRFVEKYSSRLTQDGEILIEAKRSRQREKNRIAAEERLKEMILEVLQPPRKRRKGKATYASVQKRLKTKKKKSVNKKLRSRVSLDD